MAGNKSKWLILLFALVFAVLQALQPFIHAHIDEYHPDHDTGFHVADEHDEHIHDSYRLNSEHADEHTASAVPHIFHTILVAFGIKKEVDSDPAVDAPALLLFGLCFVIILSGVSQNFPALIPARFPSLKRRLPASRAPPSP
jgi:hypothetical protein